MAWDDKNIGARLVTCAACGQSYYMTNHQRRVCVRCQDKSDAAQALADLDRPQRARREG